MISDSDHSPIRSPRKELFPGVATTDRPELAYSMAEDQDYFPIPFRNQQIAQAHN